jgi:hypothetical protein
VSDYLLPSKAFAYLRRLLLNYEHAGEAQLAAVIKHSLIAIEEDKDRYHDFGRENYGHDVIFFMAAEYIAPISLSLQAKLTDQLRDDLATLGKDVGQEYFHAVRIELADENDSLFQRAEPLLGETPVNPDSLSFWKPNQIRMFISHRDTFKGQAHALANELGEYGISCFVAHDTIEPTASWQSEIERALKTMEICVALITPDFHDSVWTNQEIGFAKARHIPTISLKLGADPRGFIGDKQALSGNPTNVGASAKEIYKLLAKKMYAKDRIQGAIISAFCSSPNWGETTTRFDRMEEMVQELSRDELDRIKTAFAKNGQLNGATYLHNRDRLLKFLASTTGQTFHINGAKIFPNLRNDKPDEDIPF